MHFLLKNRDLTWVCLYVLLVFLIPGCATPETTTRGNPRFPGATNAAPELGSDLIQAGDKLIVTFADLPTPEKPFEVTVGEDGQIVLPYQRKLAAAGKTKSRLQEEIRQEYVPQYFTRLTVNVETPNRVVAVMGEVKTPSRYPYFGQMTVLSAIAAAGGFTDYANKDSVQIIRANQKTEYVNCKKAQKDPKRDLSIYPGDIVIVPRRIL